MFQRIPCAPIFYPNLEAKGSSKSSVPTKLHGTMFQKTRPLMRSLGLRFITHGTKCLKTWSYLKLSNRVWMEFWVVSLVLEHQHAILISVCVHLVKVCVVLKPTSVYFLTTGLSQKHFAQVINIHMFISEIKNIHFIR